MGRNIFGSVATIIIPTQASFWQDNIKQSNWKTNTAQIQHSVWSFPQLIKCILPNSNSYHITVTNSQPLANIVLLTSKATNTVQCLVLLAKRTIPTSGRGLSCYTKWYQSQISRCSNENNINKRWPRKNGIKQEEMNNIKQDSLQDNIKHLKGNINPATKSIFYLVVHPIDQEETYLTQHKTNPIPRTK